MAVIVVSLGRVRTFHCPILGPRKLLLDNTFAMHGEAVAGEWSLQRADLPKKDPERVHVHRLVVTKEED